jgi:CBS domain-containing protein
MDISTIVTTDYETFDADARVSELRGAFRESGEKAFVVTDDGKYLGLVTQRRLVDSQRDPDAKARSLVWHVAKVGRTEDVRTVARLLLGSDAEVLPVFEGEDLYGLVRENDLLEAVRPNLGVLTVDDVATRELVSVGSEATLGEVLHVLRENRIEHLPVVEDGRAVGVVSVYDVLDFSAREMRRASGGSPSAEVGSGGSHGGFGERAGDLDRMLDLPVSDVMTEPVRTTAADRPLDDAVGEMLTEGISSLVVVEDGEPAGIVTKSDALRSLTWTDEARLPVQITGVDLLDDVSREEVAEMIEKSVRKYADMNLLEANVYLHEHDETLRGTSLVMARIRLFTDRGHFVGTGEGYGARHALHLARNVLERQILEGKEYGRTKKHPDDEVREKLYGWWLSGL